MAMSAGWAQAPKSGGPSAPVTVVTVDQPDAGRTRDELARLLQRYPPELRRVLALDPSLLSNPTYLAPYPGLVNFLNAHPEVARNPSYFVGEMSGNRFDRFDRGHPTANDIWREVVGGLGIFIGFSMAIGLLVWLIRTTIDYRRWSRLARVQTEVHSKLLDRFTSNNDLLSYIQSPAGSKFLESSPIKLDAGPRQVGAPMSRILWSVQGGIVLVAAGIGLRFVGGGATDDAAQPLNALGAVAIALGLGFVISAIISYMISRRLGLIEPPAGASRVEPPPGQFSEIPK